MPSGEYALFRQTLKALAHKGQIEMGKRHTVRRATLHRQFVGIYRSVQRGGGFVRPRPEQGLPTGDIFIRAKNAGDAASGDVVLVDLLKLKFPAKQVRDRGSSRAPEGRILEVIERATRHFVGTYSSAEGEGLVRVDGRIFGEEIYVGDAASQRARDGEKVVFEMLRFPSPEMTGEGTITEILGPRAEPRVEMLSVIRQFHLPDEFPEEVLDEARGQARQFAQQKVGPDRLDLTDRFVVTIDPPDARDFDDAISLEREERGFWRLGVHIADVSTFVPQGSALDHEARHRGTSVYLPGKVLPMLPEQISSGIASLQEDQVRYTKSALIEFDPQGRITAVDLANAAIRVTQRLTYQQVMDLWQGDASDVREEIRSLLQQMRELAAILRRRRIERGMLALEMSEPILEYDQNHRIQSVRYSESDESHQMIEEFMVTANEAVAQKLSDLEMTFLRRVHEIPDPTKLKGFAQFVRSIGISIEDPCSRFELQRVLRNVAGTVQHHAVHYALLRSLKVAEYSPEKEVHYALASDCYCHFTSPIRRYPDLSVHRLVERLLRKDKTGFDHNQLLLLAEHCSFTERRAQIAEREMVKIKVLEFLQDRVGQELEMIITGVEEYGFFAQGISLPAEGLVHIRTLNDDFYAIDRSTHCLVGKRTGKSYRLGDRVRCLLWRVDLQQRQLDLRLTEEQSDEESSSPSKQPPKEQRKKRKPKKESTRRKKKR